MLGELSLLLLLAAAAPAQELNGWVAVASQQAGGRLGPGGVWLVHSRDTAQSVRPIAGLPATLLGVPGLGGGADSVAWRRRDGALIVGDSVLPGQMAKVHVLQVSGGPNPAVTAALAFAVGTHPTGNPSVSAMAALPNDDVLFTAWGLSGGLLNGSTFGVLLANDTVVPFTVTFPPSVVPAVNALAVDSAATVAYAAVHPGGAVMDIYSIPLTQNHQPSTAIWIARVNTLVLSMALDASDRRLTVAGWQGAQNVVTLDVGVRPPVVVGSCPGTATMNAMAREPHADTVVAASFQGATTGYQVGFASFACGAFTWLAPPPPGGWGLVAGVAAAPSLVPFGTPSVNVARYEWQTDVNPGGLPRIGNTGFSVTVRCTTGPAGAGVWILDLNRQPTALPFLGIDLWVLPLHTLPLTPVTTTSARLDLPIPNALALAGARLCVQSAHVNGSMATPLDASSGLQITVF